MPTPLTVVATFTTKAAQKEILLKALQKVIELTRREPGCIYYDLYESQENPLNLMFLESWSDEQALQEHLNMPYIQELLAQSETLLEAPVQIKTWDHIR